MSPAPAKKTKKRKRTPNPSATYDLVPSISPALGPKKRKTKSGTTLMSLPYDLLLNCLARVSRLYYPTLSLVSKKLRSLLASSDLHKARSHTTTEICLYVCLSDHKKSRWFTLCRKKKGYALARVPIPYSPRAYDSDLVAAGSSIYHIASSFTLCNKPATVSILDCRSHAHHTWREAPSMRLWLNSYTACVVDGNIYVGGFDEGGNNYIEAFDTKTEMWDPDVIPCSEIYDGHYVRTASIGGKLHVLHSPIPEMVAYNSKEGKWDIVEQGPSRSLGWVLGSDPYCEIDNFLYSVYYGVIRWYDTEVRRWRELKGLVGLPKFPSKFPCETDHTFVRLADYGGKMMVFWDKSNYDGRMMIWCAEIALERRHQSGEIWGQVEWFDHVLTSRGYDLFKVLAVTV